MVISIAKLMQPMIKPIIANFLPFSLIPIVAKTTAKIFHFRYLVYIDKIDSKLK